MIDNIYLYGWCLCVYMFMYVGAHVYVGTQACNAHVCGVQTLNIIDLP